MYNKEIFLKTGIVVDNEYFSKYMELILQNENTVCEKGKTQRHHIIPKYYFLSCDVVDGIEMDSEDNLVNLLYSNHVLAHYYLSLCSSTNRYKVNNIYALKYLLGRNSYLLKDKCLMEKLGLLQDLYEFCHKNRDCAVNLKNVNVNKVWMNFEGRNYRIPKEEVEQYASIGYSIGHTFKTNTGMVWVTDGKVEKLVYPNEVDLYNNLGYHRGKLSVPDDVKKKMCKSSRHISPTTDKICINNGTKNKFINKNDVDFYLDSGWIIGPKPVKRHKPKHYKMKIPKIERVWVSKEKKNFKVEKSLLSDYLMNGYSVGRYIENPQIFNSSKKFIWMTKNRENKRVSIEDEELYISDGWIRGRNTEDIIKKRKENNKPCKKGQNKGGKYLYKDGIKKHFYGNDIEEMMKDGWTTFEQRKAI